MRNFVFTCGDINGIGPEIAIRTLAKYYSPTKFKFIFCCPANVFSTLDENLRLNLNYSIIKKIKSADLKNDKILILDLGKSKIDYGKTNAASGRMSFKSIIKAIEIIGNKQADAMITAPINKEAFALAGIDFPGHTELLGKMTGGQIPLMMFLSKSFKAALFTIHIPIKKIPIRLKKEKLVSVIKKLSESLKKDFGIINPKIAVLGLNPHAGENGVIGNEETEVIGPVISELKDIALDGPFVPDAFFANKLYKNYDAVLGMYHDQVLIPFKMLNFNTGVNYTAGLPIIRTSPDHGTAYDIAGKYIADPRSMYNSFDWALKIQNARSKDN